LSDFVLVEALQDGEPVSSGEEGELTVTNLENFAMPFIRYNLKDLDTLMNDDCSCENLFPLMRVTGGRKSDIIQLPNGRMTPALPVYKALITINGIRQFQVVQEKLNQFTVKILESDKFTEGTVEETRRRLKNILGDVEIDVSTVEDLPREESGKFNQFITKVK
jgi:phenylacetate-CoA ligase